MDGTPGGDELRRTESASMEGQVMIAPRIEVGSTLPDVTLRDLDGNAYRLSELRGQRVLLFMWASW